MESYTTVLEIEVGIDYRYFEDLSGPAEDWVEYEEIEVSIEGKIIEGLWNALPPHLRQEIYDDILSSHR